MLGSKTLTFGPRSGGGAAAAPPEVQSAPTTANATQRPSSVHLRLTSTDLPIRRRPEGTPLGAVTYERSDASLGYGRKSLTPRLSRARHRGQLADGVTRNLLRRPFPVRRAADRARRRAACAAGGGGARARRAAALASLADPPDRPPPRCGRGWTGRAKRRRCPPLRREGLVP